MGVRPKNMFSILKNKYINKSNLNTHISLLNTNTKQQMKQPITNIKAFLETSEYQYANARLSAEINANPLVIDYSVFKKSPAEKLASKVAKSQYKIYKKNTQC